MIKIPKSIFVAGVEYKFVIEKDLTKDRHFLAYCDVRKKEIAVDADHLKDADCFHTLLHEIKHAHQAEYGLNQAVSHELREIDAETTATMLLSIFDIKFKAGPPLKLRKTQGRLKK